MTQSISATAVGEAPRTKVTGAAARLADPVTFAESISIRSVNTKLAGLTVLHMS